MAANINKIMVGVASEARIEKQQKTLRDSENPLVLPFRINYVDYHTPIKRLLVLHLYYYFLLYNLSESVTPLWKNSLY
jgi:hypothetical protein